MTDDNTTPAIAGVSEGGTADEIDAVHTPVTPENSDRSDTSASPNREAAKYRTQLREKESQLTDAQTRIERFQRREVERIAAERLAQPADVLAFGAELSAMIGEDGEVDAELVGTAVTDLTTSRPGLAKGARPGPRHSDFGQGRTGASHAAPAAAWSDVIKRRGQITAQG